MREGEMSRWGKKHHHLFPVSILIRACTYICVCDCVCVYVYMFVCVCLLCVERLYVCVCVPGLIVPMAVAYNVHGFVLAQKFMPNGDIVARPSPQPPPPPPSFSLPLPLGDLPLLPPLVAQCVVVSSLYLIIK